MRRKLTWVLVADGQQARCLEGEGRLEVLHEVPEMKLSADDFPSRHNESEPRGRIQESASSERHAIEPRTPPARQRERDFAKAVAARISAAHEKYDHLVLLASPKTLGDLREFISKAAQNKITAEAAKDFTNSTDKEVAERLQEIFSK